MPTPASPQSIVNQAMKLMNEGNYSVALNLFLTLEQAGMRDPRLFRSIGVAYERLSKLAQACAYFERSINLAPKQPDLHTSLAKLLTKQKRWSEAESWHERNIAHFPSLSSYVDYGFYCLTRGTPNLGGAQYVTKAKHLFSSAESRFGDSAEIQLGMAQVLAEEGNWDAQNGLLIKSAAKYPTNLKLKRALAWSDKQCGKYQDAIATYTHLLNTNDGNEDDAKRLALTLLEQGAITEALSHLHSAVKQYPFSQALHKLLASIRFESGDENFLDGYAVNSLHAVNNDSKTLPLILDFIDQSIDAKHYTDAEKALDEMPSPLKTHPMVMSRQAKLAYRCEDDEQCISLTSTLLKKSPDTPALIELRALASLSLGDYNTSREDIAKLLTLAPNDQFYWGLQSVQWRLDADARYHWLCNYDALVKRVPVEIPHGFTTKPAFLDAVKTSLVNLHVTKRHPLTQSLREGTQTPGELFLRQDDAIQALAGQLNKTCTQVLSPMNIDKHHPTYCERLNGVSFQTSWSVKLKNQGFHASHVHPKGWFSSAFYVQVPAISENNEKQGWLHLGKPGIRVHTPLEPEHWVKPEAGVLALFPSFMWHGTVPFDSTEERISVAFDLLPEKN